jgi:hypothetical protein
MPLVVMYQHMLKCAGTTAMKILPELLVSVNPLFKSPTRVEAWGTGLNWFEAPTPNVNWVRGRLLSAPLFHGHFAFGLHEIASTSRAPLYWSVLRSPKDRLLSWWGYTSRERRPNPDGTVYHNDSPEEFIANQLQEERAGPMPLFSWQVKYSPASPLPNHTAFMVAHPHA